MKDRDKEYQSAINNDRQIQGMIDRAREFQTEIRIIDRDRELWTQIENDRQRQRMIDGDI